MSNPRSCTSAVVKAPPWRLFVWLLDRSGAFTGWGGCPLAARGKICCNEQNIGVVFFIVWKTSRPSARSQTLHFIVCLLCDVREYLNTHILSLSLSCLLFSWVCVMENWAEGWAGCYATSLPYMVLFFSSPCFLFIYLFLSCRQYLLWPWHLNAANIACKGLCYNKHCVLLSDYSTVEFFNFYKSLIFSFYTTQNGLFSGTEEKTEVWVIWHIDKKHATEAGTHPTHHDRSDPCLFMNSWNTMADRLSHTVTIYIHTMSVV